MTAIHTIEKKHNFKFVFGSAGHELYEASGCSEDWARDIARINYTYVIELKPTKFDDFDQSGFEVPEDQIEQVGAEMYDGFVAYINSFLADQVINESIRAECKSKLDALLGRDSFFS